MFVYGGQLMPTCSSYSLFIHHCGIILQIYTLIIQTDKYNFRHVCASIGFSYYAMIYSHQGHIFTSEKVHTNMSYLGLEWLDFHLLMHFKAYYLILTLKRV